MRRRLAREIALQCLYHLELNECTRDQVIRVVLEEAREDNETNLDMPEEPWQIAFVESLIDGVTMHFESLDERLNGIMDEWSTDRLSRVDKHVLRMAAYEMIHHPEVPRKAVINEAIELAKRYGNEQSGKFVNGILGKLYQQLEGLPVAEVDLTEVLADALADAMAEQASIAEITEAIVKVEDKTE